MGKINIFFFSSISLSVKGMHDILCGSTKINFDALPFQELLNLSGKFINKNTIVILDDDSITAEEQTLINSFVFEKNIPVKKILITASRNKTYLISFICGSIDGIISSRASAKTLKECIASVEKGSRYFDKSISDFLTGTVKDGLTEKLSRITKGEMKIIKCMRNGMSVKEIAEVLCIEQKTVESHISHIIGKIGFKSARELAVFAASEIFNIFILLLFILPQEIT